MKLKGEYIWFRCLRMGGQKAISFELYNSAWLGQEEMNIALISSDQTVSPLHYANVVIKHGESLSFNYDTVGWNWKQGDSFVLLDNKGKIKKNWPLNLSTYAQGECPECHGTHRCNACQGKGVITDYRTHMVSSCQVCHGTGSCQTCYIPTNTNSPKNLYVDNSQPNPTIYKEQRKIMLRRRIVELQNKIDRMERDKFVRDIRNAWHPVNSSFSLSVAESTLKLQYEQELINAQSELEQLELMDLRS